MALEKGQGILCWGRNTHKDIVIIFMLGGERLTNDYRLTECERELLQRHRSSERSLNWLQDLHVVQSLIIYSAKDGPVRPSMSLAYLCHGSNQFSCDILFFWGFAGFLVNI